ncbi:diaminopimelate decarboxylase [Bacteriovorax sp. DB6_IX]|uniref:diaminopimelate decarboxylase n=1 Tax=Bacteriovorax sp. DB6_IX TaxID=1353530 RepID=UPI000389EA92|nr:diaminopimelate decarboxylase [Bacteriovorax sp. DB6_IX]EQC51169.1 diaminopimelate decarboxylase [Bacteriovorax sp. DB6_IX]
MTNLNYKNSQLHLFDANIPQLTKKLKTPFYLYCQNTLEDNYLNFYNSALEYNIERPLVCFALKANPNHKVVKTLAKLGAGADIVSGGELKRALECGIDPQKIVFSGVGKTREEITYALKCHKEGIYSFNVESLEELELINSLAKKLKKTARVAFRLNPQVQVKTHKHISTGFKTHKFGLLKEDIVKAIKSKKYWSSTKLVGLSIHIGSQLTCLKATVKAITELTNLALEKKLQLEFFDLGGGLGVDYEKSGDKPSASDYMELVSKTLDKNYHSRTQNRPRIVFEPGRSISATAGHFITRVIRTKESGECFFAIVDGGMNDFVRTSLYGAYHEIIPLSLNRRKKVRTDIVGPICETADCFGSGRLLPKLQTDDLISVSDVGAYGYSMSSNYNMREKPSEFFLTNTGKIQKA